ncbi:MAG: hypothetical protein RIQ93_2882 [Verrucomicrobiota bacterium]|jgi:acyl transferase domain-containing protein
MNTSPPEESIAIVGMAGRFPQAQNLEEFWRNLRNGVEAVTFFNDHEVEWLPLEHPPKLNDPRFVKARAVLRNAEWFDAAFFNINPREAELMDPQQRVFLECSWEALEDAGCNPETFEGLIGVFAGASMNTYLFTNILTNKGLIEDFGLFSTMLLNASDFVTTRVSYKLNLRGPSINVQTACSTSLVAVCLAAQNLLQYRCDVALAGGVSITYPANRGQHHLAGGIVSDDGHCRAFDAKATGTVLGDGAGVVVLKRLSDALAAGDHVYAVIKGTAINNDGAAKIGFTAPSIDGQAEVIALAQSEAGVAPESISYVEAHGTGTPLGDPIEVAGLTKAFGPRRGTAAHCALGSVKSNIGHLDVAAGIAGLIKTVLALHHGEIPPSLHFEKPNAKIDFAHSPFFVNNRLRAWPPGTQPRRAGVSSFGIGGTNAHVVLEESPVLSASSPVRSPQLLVLSARSTAALEAATDNLAAYLRSNPDVNLADVAFTTQTGRKVFSHRRALVCRDVADALSAIASRDKDRVFTGDDGAERQKVAFMFPGQGAQTLNMARDLYERESAFRAQVDQSCEILTPLMGLDLRDVLFPSSTPGPTVAERAAVLLNETRITQPALFVIEHALAQLWIGWGIRPQAMIGHSLGEYVAACLAGVFSLETALTLVVERARFMQAQPPGAMVAVRLPEQQLAEWLNQNLALAAVNAPGLCVVSGPFDEIEALEQKLTAGAITFKRLATSHAFHSAMMEPVLKPFRETLARIALRAPQQRWISNVTGRWITAEQAISPDYWVAHLRGTVRFADGIAELTKQGVSVLLEVGPGETLAALVQRSATPAKKSLTTITSLGRIGKQNRDEIVLTAALGKLWIAGVLPEWRQGVHAHVTRRILSLPGYPFERKRHWTAPGRAPISGETSDARPASTVRLAATFVEYARPADTPSNLAKLNGGRVGTLTMLREIFKELSGVKLGDAQDETTFYELGFDSLFLTQASVAVAKHFATDLTFRQLRDEYVTLGKLSAHLDSIAKHDRSPLSNSMPPVNGSAGNEVRLPLTEAQQKIWITRTTVNDAPIPNEEVVLRIDGPLDVAELQRSIQRILERYAALRTTFSVDGAIQIVHAATPVPLPLYDFAGANASVRLARVRECAGDEVDRPFDIVAGPLFRATLLRLESGHHWLVLVAHPLITSGGSLASLALELAEVHGAHAQSFPVTLSSWRDVDAPVRVDSNTRIISPLLTNKL